MLTVFLHGFKSVISAWKENLSISLEEGGNAVTVTNTRQRKTFFEPNGFSV